MQDHLELGPLVLRAAVLPLETLEPRVRWLDHHLADPLVAAGQAHASPSLFDALREGVRSPRAEHAGTTAVARAAGRPVPFGLLATWTRAQLGPATELTLGVRDELELHVRTPPSTHRRNALATHDAIAVSPFAHLEGARWRMLSAGDGSPTATLIPDRWMRAVVDHIGLSPEADRPGVLQALVAKGLSAAQAEGYLEQLLDTGLVGPSPVQSATGGGTSDVWTWTPERTPAAGRSVDTVRPGRVTIGPELVQELHRGLDLLRRIAPPRPSHLLERFASAFERRFGDHAVPLLVALDPERGVGFTTAAAPSDLPLPDPPEGAGERWTARDERLLALVARQVDGEVVLAEADVVELELDRPAPLPAAGAAVVSLGPRGTVWWRLFSGPSGTAVLTRVASGWPELAADLSTHATAADAVESCRVVELVTLPPDDRVDVAVRPALRAAELVVESLGSGPVDQRLTLRDLRVAVTHGRIVLLDPDGHEVQVRHSTLWNTQLSDSDVVQFLSQLQDPDGHGARAWSWGALDHQPWTPRIRIGRSVLAPQTWRLTQADVDEVRSTRSVDDLRQRHGWPRIASFGEPGAALVMDLDEPTQAAAAADLLGKGHTRLVQEIPDPPVTSPEGRHVHDLVVGVLDRRRRSRPPVRLVEQPRHTPGSPWLSTTWEATPAAVDRLLREHIPALIHECRPEQWFFLRYSDPHFHLRLRLKGGPDLLEAVHAAHARAHLLTSRLTVDTYVPEAARYPDVARAEAAFAADSAAVLQLLPGLPPGDRWRIAAVGAELLLRALDVPQALEAWDRGVTMDGAHEAAGKAFRTDRVTLLGALDDPDSLVPGARAIYAQRDARLRELAITDLATATSLAHLHVNRLLVDRHRQHESVITDLLLRLRRVPRP